VCLLRAHEIGNRERRIPAENCRCGGVPQAARVALQDPSRKGPEASMGSQSNYGEGGKARTGGERVRAGKEQNRTGHPKRELIWQVSPPLFPRPCTTAESRSTCQRSVASYFTLHKLREIRPKLHGIYNSLTQHPLKATLTANPKGTWSSSNIATQISSSLHFI